MDESTETALERLRQWDGRHVPAPMADRRRTFDVLWIVVILEFIGLIVLIILVTQIIDLFEALQAWWRVRNHLAVIPDLQAMRAEADAELAGLLVGTASD